MSKIKEFVGKISGIASKNASTILTGTTVLGIISTGVLAYRSGLKADSIIKKYSERISKVPPYDKQNRTPVLKEFVKEMVPIVLPPFIVGVSTVACAIGSNTVSKRKIALLSAAYSLSEETVRNLNGKMMDMLGPKKSLDVRESLIKDKFKKSEKKEEVNYPVIVPGNGDVRCKDLYTGRYFPSNAEKIGRAINEVSARSLYETYVSLNDFYELLRLETVPMGDDLGWNSDDLTEGRLPIFMTAIVAEDGVPCLCLDYDIHIRCDTIPKNGRFA